MKNNRRNFLKKSCLAGGSLCGFSTLISGKNNTDQEASDPDKNLMREWISNLMVSLDKQTDEEVSRQIMKKCALVHYDQLKMDEVLQPYLGDLIKFIQFLNSSWNWLIEFDEEKQIILVDENKSYCVCPMVDQEKGVKSAILCYCSEGFAELMFSNVTGRPVEARVISSIHRGNDRCKYEIKIT